VKAVYVRGGLVSFKSLLDSPFCYFPHDAVIPGILQSDNYGLADIAKMHEQRGLRLEGLVDGLNRRVDQKAIEKEYRNVMFSRPAHNLMVLRERPSAPADVAAWLTAQVKK